MTEDKTDAWKPSQAQQESQKLKIHGYPSDHRPPGPIDLLANPFHVLGIAPGGHLQQVQAAFDRALQNQPSSAPALTLARDVILDPQLRLPHELGYPIDSASADIEEIFLALTGSASLEDCLSLASRLPPLSKGNFLGHLAAHQPASSALLSALLDAHASIVVSEIFDILRGLRALAGLPAPALVSVGEGLVELAESQARAALARYGSIQEASGPMLACMQNILTDGERHHIEALEPFLAAYRQPIVVQRSAAIEGIEKASGALLREPTDTASLDDLKGALLAWTSICHPMVLWCLHRRHDDPELELPVDQLHDAIAELSGRECYDIARDLAVFGRETFGMLPGASDLFDDDLGLIDAKTHPPQSSRSADLTQSPGLHPRRMRLLAGLALASVLCAAGVYFGARTLWPPPSSGTAAATVREGSEVEIMPAVGAGQHLELGGVRYCKFQEARLLLIKPDVHGTEDTRRFNQLAQDYNSRCADFFYRDSDLAIVKAEMAQNSQRLAADAKRVLSTWPGRDSAAATPAKQP